MATTVQPRRIVKTFNVRLDLLERLEARVPRGERSAFVEELLLREFDKPVGTQARK